MKGRNIRRLLRYCLGTMLALAGAPQAYAAPLEKAQQDALLKLVERQAPGLGEDALAIWNFAEVGYQETRSSTLLQNRLRKAGFTVTAGVAGMPTAFVASFRNGDGPVIGILAEYDALPGLAQQAQPTQQSIAGQVAGHGCGHNIFGAASVASAISLSNWMKAKGVKGEIRVYGSPAEEGGSGKVYLVREGLFEDVDTVIHWHPGDRNSASQARSMANISGKFRFNGVSAHAAGSPELGRSALDGVQVMNVAVEHIREHVPDGTRIHYVITNGGKAPNVVPDFAEVYYYVRHVEPEIVKSVWERVVKASQGAAIATETKSSAEITGGVYSMLPNRTLMEVMDRNLRAIPISPWTAQEQSWAQTLSQSLSKKLDLDATRIEEAKFGEGGGGSTDVSDVSWTVPTVGLGTMTWVPATPAHSWQSTAASGTSLGVKGGVVAAQTMTLVAAELLQSPEVIAKAKEEFLAARGSGFVYSPMLGDRAPALDYRKQASE